MFTGRFLREPLGLCSVHCSGSAHVYINSTVFICIRCVAAPSRCNTVQAQLVLRFCACTVLQLRIHGDVNDDNNDDD